MHMVTHGKAKTKVLESKINGKSDSDILIAYFYTTLSIPQMD